jgi:hypothetical protein
MKKVVGVVVLLACLASCAPSQVYIRAERSIYDAVAPEYRVYVERDVELSDEQRARRVRTLERWNDLIKAAEAAAVKT